MLGHTGTTSSFLGVYEIILEIKAQEHGELQGAWTAYRFVLKKQTFSPYMIGVDESPLGSLNVKGAHAEILPTSPDHPQKFPFRLNVGKNSVFFFCADSEESREECIFMLNYAAADEYWTDPFKAMNTNTIDENDVTIEDSSGLDLGMTDMPATSADGGAKHHFFSF